MRNSIKTELWKAFHSKMCILAFSLGILLALFDVLENAETVASLTKATIDSVAGNYGTGESAGYSLFIMWMPINGTNFGSRAFYFLWPIIAALPYGWSYVQERRNGMYNLIVSRSGKPSYFTSKYIATFISGGAVIAIPVIFNLLANAMVCPDSKPLLGITPIFNGHFLSQLYYSSPWIFAFIWSGVEFLFGGAAACFCLIFGAFFRYQAFAVLSPFLCFSAFNAIYPFLLELTGSTLEFSPLQLAEAATLNSNPEWIVFTVLFVLISASILLGRWQVVRRETI